MPQQSPGATQLDCTLALMFACVDALPLLFLNIYKVVLEVNEPYTYRTHQKSQLHFGAMFATLSFPRSYTLK